MKRFLIFSMIFVLCIGSAAAEELNEYAQFAEEFTPENIIDFHTTVVDNVETYCVTVSGLHALKADALNYTEPAFPAWNAFAWFAVDCSNAVIMHGFSNDIEFFPYVVIVDDVNPEETELLFVDRGQTWDNWETPVETYRIYEYPQWEEFIDAEIDINSVLDAYR